MKPKKIELLLFLILILFLILGLLEYDWIKPLLILDFLSLIGIWILGYIKRINYNNGFDKSKFWERILSIPLIFGLIFNVTSTSYSALFIALGLLCLIPYYLVKGTRTIIKKDIFTGIELIFISIVLLGFFLRLRHFPGGSSLKVYFMSLLQILYLVMSVNFVIIFVKQKVKYIGIVGMFSYWILGVYVNAVLFDTMFWPGDMNLFWIALISSIIVLPILVALIYKNKNLSENLKIQNNKLLKRFVLLSSISLFFAVATPKQYLRLDYGNRPQIIDAEYNCRLNYDIDEMTKEKNCNECQQLDQVLRSGYYREGISDYDLEQIKSKLSR